MTVAKAPQHQFPRQHLTSQKVCLLNDVKREKVLLLPKLRLYLIFQIVSKIYLPFACSSTVMLEFHINGPFTANGYMVQNMPCWRASYAQGHPKQRKFKFNWMESLCFACPIYAPCSPAAWRILYRVVVSCKGPINHDTFLIVNSFADHSSNQCNFKSTDTCTARYVS